MSWRNKYFQCCLLLLILGLASCTDDSYIPENDLQNQLVIEGYIFEGEPVDHIKVTKIHSEGEANPIPVADAQVKLKQDGLEFMLELDPTRPGTYRIGDTSVIFTGQSPIQLSVVHGGRTYQAETRFPPEISELMISQSIIYINEIDENATVATLSWQAPESSTDPHYAVFLRGIPEMAPPVNSYSPEDNSQNPFFSIHESETVQLKSWHFSHYGSYNIYVSTVNAEFIQISERGQNSVSLTDAPSNINGGLGVFTAFSGSSVEITVQ